MGWKRGKRATFASLWSNPRRSISSDSFTLLATRWCAERSLTSQRRLAKEWGPQPESRVSERRRKFHTCSRLVIVHCPADDAAPQQEPRKPHRTPLRRDLTSIGTIARCRPGQQTAHQN